MNIATRLLEPLFGINPDVLIEYAENQLSDAHDNIEYASWSVILKAARFMKFADWLFDADLDNEDE